MNRLASGFREVWLVDFEFGQQPTGLQDVRCVAARELFSGRHFRWWVDELGELPANRHRTRRVDCSVLRQCGT